MKRLPLVFILKVCAASVKTQTPGSIREWLSSMLTKESVVKNNCSWSCNERAA